MYPNILDSPVVTEVYLVCIDFLQLTGDHLRPTYISGCVEDGVELGTLCLFQMLAVTRFYWWRDHARSPEYITEFARFELLTANLLKGHFWDVTFCR